MKMAAAASFSYKIGGGRLIFQQNWRWQQGFGNITGGCSDMVWMLVANFILFQEISYYKVVIIIFSLLIPRSRY